MNQALAINLGILLVVLAGLVFTQNPLMLMGIFFLRDMPYQLAAMAMDSSEQEGSRPIGFTADVD